MNPINVSYFDEEYYNPGKKSSYIFPFTWEVEARNSRIKAEILDNMFNLKNKTVLDVGCAKGFLVKALLERNIDAYGFDISEWAIEHCEPEVKNRVHINDITLSTLAQKYDLVYSSSAMEHIDISYFSDNRPIINLCNLSKEWIFLHIPIGLGLFNEPWGDPSHKTYMNPSWWISLFLKEGFIFDLRRSRQSDDSIYHSIELVFRKERLLEK